MTGNKENADGSVTDPDTGKKVEDESDDAAKPKKEGPQSKIAKKKKAAKEAGKKADENKMMKMINPYDGLIHLKNGKLVDPVDG